MTNKITREEITTLQNDLVALEESYLRSKGWRYTCDFPDNRWRWGKVFNGKFIATNTDDALSMQDAEDGEN